jgi:hypothetical protein
MSSKVHAGLAGGVTAALKPMTRARMALPLGVAKRRAAVDLLDPVAPLAASLAPLVDLDEVEVDEELTNPRIVATRALSPAPTAVVATLAEQRTASPPPRRRRGRWGEPVAILLVALVGFGFVGLIEWTPTAPAPVISGVAALAPPHARPTLAATPLTPAMEPSSAVADPPPLAAPAAAQRPQPPRPARQWFPSSYAR